MLKYLVVTLAVIATVSCAPAKKRQTPNSLRLRAENAVCPLDYKMFSVPAGAIIVDKASFEALSKNKVDPKDSDDVKKAKEARNGKFELASADVYKYVYGKETPASIFTEGSTRVSIDAASGWTTDSIDTKPTCDSMNTVASTAGGGTHAKPGPGQLVNINEVGIESFELPSMVVTSGFATNNQKISKKPMSANEVTTILSEMPGNDSNSNRSWYLLSDGGYLEITYTESPTTITVVRAQYAKAKAQ